MLRTVLWIAGACAAVLVALAVSRELNLGQPAPPPAKPAPPAEPAKPPETVAAAAPPPAPPPEPEAKPKPPPTPEELQVQEDAAATGMTTPVAPKAAQPPN